MAPDPTANTSSESVYILITQCLQNGFFLEDENRLCLPLENAARILVGWQPDVEAMLETPAEVSARARDQRETRLPGIDYAARAARMIRQPIRRLNRQDVATQPDPDEMPYKRFIEPEHLQEGPLYRFFAALISPDTPCKDPLHVINIRDWHEASTSYDQERQRYGPHCFAGTWSAAPIDGFDDFLQPWLGDKAAAAAARTRNGHKDKNRNTTFYDVHSDSVFDFKPKYPRRGDTTAEGELAFPAEKVQPSAQRDKTPPPDSDKQDLDDLARQENKSELACILDHLIGQNDAAKHVYVVVIGVYTDIKIQTLLTGLRSRYPVDNLIVSDVLTAAPSLERHLAALDFAAKVLNVEVRHSLNDLVGILRPATEANADQSDIPSNIPAERTLFSINFRDYETFFLDKQNLLAYQDQKQFEYLQLTQRRSVRVYNQILNTNRLLIFFGFSFLALTLALGVLRVADPGHFGPETLNVMTLTGVASLAQFALIFFRDPLNNIQNNLNNLFRLRTILETHSLSVALMRFHFSRPEFLQRRLDTDEALQIQLDLLRQQMGMIDEIARMTDAQLDELNLGMLSQAGAVVSPPTGTNTTAADSQPNAENVPPMDTPTRAGKSPVE